MSGSRTQSDHVESGVENHPTVENQLVVHVLAPLVVIGATWGVRKVLNSSYRMVTGHSAPNSQDTQVKLGSALAWAAITAASAAVVEVAVFRFLARKG
jgi:hypothetical protein